MKKSQPLTFLFENPNSPTIFEKALKQILLKKLLSEFYHAEVLSVTKHVEHNPL